MSKETSKSQIGKGIRALLAQVDDRGPVLTQQEEQSLSTHSLEIPVDAISVNPYQPRTDFDTEALEELAQSIRIHGIIQPLTVRRLEEGKYQLIAGERRLRASKLAGLQTVPAFIRLSDDQGMLEMAIVENIQRSDLNAMEMAFSMQRLLEECNLTHEELSQRLGKSRSAVTNFLRLLKLPPKVQQAIRDEAISMGHARAIAGLFDVSAQLMVLGEVLQKNLSVRETEKIVSQYQDKPIKSIIGKTQLASVPAEIKQIEKQLSTIFGVKVNLQYKADQKGSITIPFNSDHELNEIIDMMESIDNK